MDALDVRIVRAMGLRPYGRPDPDALRAAVIARRVDTTVDTVKDRIARLESSGVLAGYEVVPNLSHLGLSGAAYLLRAGADAEKKAVADEARRSARLLEMHDFIGAGFCVDFAFATVEERDRVLARLAELAGGAVPLRFYGREMPEVERRLTTLDWRILGAMRGNARRSLREIAAQLGVSQRTVKRRRDGMAREGSFFVLPLLDASRAAGLILFKLTFHLAPDARVATPRALLRELDDHQVYAYVPSAPEIGNFDMILAASTTAEVEVLRQRAEAVPGVDRAEVWLFRGFWYCGEWIDQEIQARAQEGRLSISTTAAPDTA